MPENVKSPWFMPTPKISDETLRRIFTDPELLSLEFLYVSLTCLNIFVMWGIMQWVWRCPVFVTWCQFVVAFVSAWIFGEAGRDFPSSAFFPPLKFSRETLFPLLLPIFAYIFMQVTMNLILRDIDSIAAFPTIAGFAVALHHTTRFFGCGQVYMPVRWISVGLLVLAFTIAVSDVKFGGPMMLAAGSAYAIFTSAYRGCFLEKAMHVVQGNGNILHNNQLVLGILFLPFLSAAALEHKFILNAPMRFDQLYTWQYWFCLVAAGFLPFAKNVISNRLIRRGGPETWRLLELGSIIIISSLGFALDHGSIAGVAATTLMVTGRGLGSLDAMSQEPLQVRQKRERDDEIERQLLEYAEPDNGSEEYESNADSFAISESDVGVASISKSISASREKRRSGSMI